MQGRHIKGSTGDFCGYAAGGHQDGIRHTCFSVVVITGHSQKVNLGTKIVNLYATCGNMGDALIWVRL